MTDPKAWPVLLLMLAAWPGGARAQAPDGLRQTQLDEASKFGGLAAVTPLCGLRDGAWAADLWQASIRALGPADDASSADRQRRADMAGAVLSHAEDEALESFADAAPEVTCGPLGQNPDLKRADDMVAAYRRGAHLAVW